MEQQRRLSAIMFTDIQGYTALMQQSEDAALRVRERHRLIFNRTTQAFHGKIIQYYGDGTLSVFESTVDAVRCGIEMQRAFQEDPMIPVRIGLHSGDTIFSDDDVIGDGVNIASRVESLAIPGGILVSDTVYDQVKNHDDIRLKYVGDFKLKNVGRPMGVYAVANEGLAVPKKRQVTGKLEKSKVPNRWVIAFLICAFLAVGFFWLRNPNTQRPVTGTNNAIAVLPLTNLSADPDQEYFVAGMHDALIGKLAQISALKVTSKTSTLGYRNTVKPIPEIAKELGVDVIVEGSVLHVGDSVRIQIQMIDAAPVETHLWEKTYDRRLEHILAMQNEIILDVARGVEVVLSANEQSRLHASPTINPEAYEYYLKGQFLVSKFNPQDVRTGLEYYQKALEIDPDFLLPYSGLAMVWATFLVQGGVPPRQAGPIMEGYVGKAMLDSTSASAQFSRGILAFSYQWDWDVAEEAFERAIQINPNYDAAHIFYAHFLVAQGRISEAYQHADLAIELDPLNALTHGLRSAVLLFGHDFDAAIEAATIALRLDPHNPFAHAPMAGAYSATGRQEQAVHEFVALFTGVGDTEIARTMDSVNMHYGWRAAHLAVARKLEERSAHTFVKPHLIAGHYAAAGETEKALDWLEKCYAIHDHDMIYINAAPYGEQIRSDPRFKVLLEKMAFQHPM